MANEKENKKNELPKGVSDQLIARLYFIIGRIDSVSLLIDYADVDDKFSKATTILDDSSSSLKEIVDQLRD